MVRKVCSSCGKASYSLSKNGIWICPHCQADLTRQPISPLPRCVNQLIPIKGASLDSINFN